MTAMTTLTHLVTGATDGIGLETAAELSAQKIRVLVHGRTEAKAKKACAQVLSRVPGAELVPVFGDLASLAEVRALADQVKAVAPRLDVLLNNAGVYVTDRELSKDGFELTVAVNHLAPFLLTHLLLDLVKAAPRGRVVNVSSIAHGSGRVRLDDLFFERHYDGYSAYASSKLMNVYFTHELARRLGPGPVTVNALHPGVINTKLLRLGFGMGGASLATGARTSVYCATAPELAGVTGRYFNDAREAKVAPHASDAKLERALYERSCELTGTTPLPLS
jgi:NAD(P)-dependent dehydrogenase (short-subunit alcohol dehydrogenase family)